MNSNLAQSNAPSGVAALLEAAVALHRRGQLAEAIMAYQKVLAQDPANFDAYHALGQAANKMGQQTMAEGFFRAALSIRPDSAAALNEFGMLLLASERLDQALDCFLKALELCPDSPEVNFNAATAYYDKGDMDAAMRYYQTALALKHDSVSAHSRVGMIHFTRDHDLSEAWESFVRAHHLEPDNIDVLNLLAKIRINQGRSDEAIPYVSKVLSQHPEHQMASMLMKHAEADIQDHTPAKEAFFNSGLIDLAEALARDDLSKDNSVENHNFLLKCYLASDRHTAADYFRESREWSKLHAHEELLPHPGDFKNDRNPDRRLKVGIVGDYFDSVIGAHTLYPYFRAHDRSKIELYCYNFGIGEAKIRPIVDQYRDIRKLPGADFFALVRRDEIDIMLDINGRIRSPNYFETLLRQPAPIQLNWYNLPCTVGVKAYNYVITDEYCVREGEENVFVEKIFKMPPGTICAWDMGEPPVVARPRCETNGYVTFGCFGDFFKVNERVLATWADLLGQVPRSRLYLKSNNLRLPAECVRVRDFFKRRGIDAERLILEGMSHYKHMKKSYELIDIALDTFPYSSGSTTINALWQGVPVITIEGNDWRGRSTGAILAGAGLDRFIAGDTAGYIAKAAALAADPARLVELRATLGKHVAASPQWQVAAFARNFESRLRMIWQDWLREPQ